MVVAMIMMISVHQLIHFLFNNAILMFAHWAFRMNGYCIDADEDGVEEPRQKYYIKIFINALIGTTPLATRSYLPDWYFYWYYYVTKYFHKIFSCVGNITKISTVGFLLSYLARYICCEIIVNFSNLKK